jgi:Winged helix-turn-helix domain (DUF2582)
MAEKANVKDRVGSTAGQIWHTLSNGGPLTITQLKKKLDGEGELLNFALGWLAREDKIELIPDRKSFRVQLR